MNAINLVTVLSEAESEVKRYIREDGSFSRMTPLEQSNWYLFAQAIRGQITSYRLWSAQHDKQ
jgi:hypothetical protein